MTGPVDRLRYHVSGAIERGEAAPIVEVPSDEQTVERYLPTFTRAYAEAMIWANVTTGEGEDMREVEPAWWQSANPDWPVLAFDSSSQDTIRADCESFVRANLADLRELDPGQCGHDFALTRNHHGAGFWDRGYGELGERLTRAAHAYGESSGYVGEDGSEITLD